MTLFSIRGIPVRLHWSFVWLGGGLLLFDALSHGLGGAAEALVLGVMVFGSVLLHELGHALTARRFGIGTRDITLYPFGGIAAITAEPRQPRVELAVAVAGPLVNVALAGLGLWAWKLGLPGAGIFATINAGMALFNLLPAYPMDGGRVLRAFWSLHQDRVRATLRAIKVGRGFGWAMIAAGLLWSPSLVLVGGFLLIATASERRRTLLMAHATPPRPTRWVHAAPQARQLHHWDHPAV